MHWKHLLPIRRRLGLGAITLATMLAWAPSSSAQVVDFGPLPRGLEPKQQQEIEALVQNVWDQKMARQMGMALEMPATEVGARLAILASWAEIHRQRGGALPEGFAESLEQHRKLVARVKSGEPGDLGPVLSFLEDGVAAIQKALAADPP